MPPFYSKTEWVILAVGLLALTTIVWMVWEIKH
jgi:hypothetical protein